MHSLLFKILVLIPLLALLSILTYKKINESFDSSNDTTTNTTVPTTTVSPQTTIPAALISTQLTTGIATLLGVSLRRITNVDYSGDISTQSLAVSFTVLDPNLLESGNGELAAASIANNANNLFTQGNFIIPINGVNVRLTKANQASNVNDANNANNVNDVNDVSTIIGLGSTTMEPSTYFNNKGLLDTANYAIQVYDTVPVDSAATRFFTLQPDSNFNLMPVLPTTNAN
jgi:hypothetical protein